MRWKFWGALKEDLRPRVEISYKAYARAQQEHKELGECIARLRRYQEMFCPNLKASSHIHSNVTYHNPELYVAIEDRIKKIVQMQVEIVL